jgi:hypothetical protein
MLEKKHLISELEAAKLLNVSRSSVQAAKRAKKKKATGPQWTAEEAARDVACLETINKPSIFPVDAHIPGGEEIAEVNLRQAIGWARWQEAGISQFSQKRCDDLLRCTNRIQAYHVNWGKEPRLDGNIDQRILDWAQSLWIKRERQEERLSLAKKLRLRTHNPVRRSPRKIIKAPPLSFEDRFKNFWLSAEKALDRRFNPKEKRKLIRAFKKELEEFFSEISAEKTSPAKVAGDS